MRTVVSDIEDAMVISGNIEKELKRESNEEKIPRTSPALCDMTSYLSLLTAAPENGMRPVTRMVV